MGYNKALTYLLAALFATSTVTIGVTGCDKKDKETEEDDDKKKDKDEEEEEEEEEEEALTDTGAVKTYPGMTPAGGTYRLLQPFSVYTEADAASTKLTGLAPGTLVNFKNYYKDWILVDWPSGPGQLSPGWIQVRPNSPKLKVVTTETPDAAAEVVDAAAEEPPDAGTEPPDAGKTEDPPDAGAKPKFKLKLPALKPKNK